jgi:anti-sigma regulatory factor (Ser/Thr protein kinase)
MESRARESLTLTVDARSALSGQRAVISEWIRRRASGRIADDVLLACGEAIDNAIEHGTPPVTVEMTCDESGELTIVVRDVGSWRVLAQVPSRGLGLPIMTALMDNVTIDTTDGTEIRLTRRIPLRSEE